MVVGDGEDAVGGVLAINAMAGAKSLPDMLNGAKAFAEGVAKPTITYIVAQKRHKTQFFPKPGEKEVCGLV